MNLHDAPLIFLDVTPRINPSFSGEPQRFDLVPYIGRTIFLDPRRVKFMEGQPRDEEIKGIARLAAGMKRYGQKTAILVHPIDDPDFDAELQAGERRTWACRAAKILIRAEIRPVPKNRKEHYVDAFVENFNRENLSFLEKVKSVARLVADGHSVKEIVRMSGASYTLIHQCMILATLDLQVLRMIGEARPNQRDAKGRKLRRTNALPMTIGLHIARLPVSEQLSLAKRVVGENLPIDAARELVTKLLAEKGAKLRKRPPNERFGVLERQVTKFSRFFERYLDMKGSELREIITPQRIEDRLFLAETMRETALHLSSMAEVISRECSKQESK